MNTEFDKKDISILIVVLIGIIVMLTGVVYKDRLQINNLLIRNEQLIDEKEELQELLQESDELFSKQLVLVKELMGKLNKKEDGK